MYKTEKERIEDALIPALLRQLMFVHIEASPEVESGLQKWLKLLEPCIEENINSKKLSKRMYRVCKKVNRYFIKEQWRVQKSYMALTMLAWELIEKAAFYCTPEVIQVIEEMNEDIKTMRKDENVQKVDDSAIKHVPKILRIIQTEGYF